MSMGQDRLSDKDGGAIAVFLDKVLGNKPITIYGAGEQTRDFIFVKDIVNAVHEVLNNGDNEVFNISCNQRISINDLIDNLMKITDSNIKVVYSEFRAGDIMHSSLCNKKSNLLLCWKPKYSIHEGLLETYNYYR